jgi:hypothetical protein
VPAPGPQMLEDLEFEQPELTNNVLLEDNSGVMSSHGQAAPGFGWGTPQVVRGECPTWPGVTGQVDVCQPASLNA